MENEFVAKFLQDIDDNTTISSDTHGDGAGTCTLLICLGAYLCRSLLNVSWY